MATVNKPEICIQPITNQSTDDQLNKSEVPKQILQSTPLAKVNKPENPIQPINNKSTNDRTNEAEVPKQTLQANKPDVAKLIELRNKIIRKSFSQAAQSPKLTSNFPSIPKKQNTSFRSFSASLSLPIKKPCDSAARDTKDTLTHEIPNAISLIVLDDDNIVVTTGKQIEIWSVSQNEISTFQTIDYEAEFLKELSQNRFVALSNKQGTLKIIQRRKKDGPYFIRNNIFLSSVVRSLEELGDGRLMCLFKNNSINVWDSKYPKNNKWIELRTFTINENTLQSFMLKTGNSPTILFGSGNDIITCDIDTIILGRVEAHDGGVTALKVSNEILLSGSADKTIKLWNLSNNFQLLVTLKYANQIDMVKYDAECSGVFSLCGNSIALKTRRSNADVTAWTLNRKDFAKNVNDDEVIKSFHLFRKKPRRIILHTDKKVQIIGY